MGWIWAAGYENEGPLWCSVNWICIILFSHHWCWWKLSWLWIGLICSGDNVAMLAWQYFFYRFTSRFDDEYNMKSIFRSQFLKMGEDDGEEKEPCCPLRLRTGGKLSRITRSLDLSSTFYSPLFFFIWPGAQLIGTVLAIISGVLLVVFFAKLDELISGKYQRTFEVK